MSRPGITIHITFSPFVWLKLLYFYPFVCWVGLGGLQGGGHDTLVHLFVAGWSAAAGQCREGGRQQRRYRPHAVTAHTQHQISTKNILYT